MVEVARGRHELRSIVCVAGTRGGCARGDWVAPPTDQMVRAHQCGRAMPLRPTTGMYTTGTYDIDSFPIFGASIVLHCNAYMHCNIYISPTEGRSMVEVARGRYELRSIVCVGGE